MICNAMILKYTLLWIPMVFIAVVNGAIRDLTYKQFFGDLTANQISTATGILLFGIYIWAIGLKWKIESARQAFAVGLIWLVLTEAFELFFFHYAMGHPLEKILENFNIFKGRPWIVILIFVAMAPYIMYKIRTRHRA
jgi:hypothetical protein